VADRTTIAVATPPGGWLAPWPNVAEIAAALPHTAWTLVGGLMTQLHTIHHGLDVVRPTNDVDIVLHVETTRGLPAKAARALESLGYRMLTSIDPRERTAHRFVRGTDRIDLVTSDVVDVLVADHAAPGRVDRRTGPGCRGPDGRLQVRAPRDDAVVQIDSSVVLEGIGRRPVSCHGSAMTWKVSWATTRSKSSCARRPAPPSVA
jgi:hypothetical protein